MCQFYVDVAIVICFNGLVRTFRPVLSLFMQVILRILSFSIFEKGLYLILKNCGVQGSIKFSRQQM